MNRKAGIGGEVWENKNESTKGRAIDGEAPCSFYRVVTLCYC